MVCSSGIGFDPLHEGERIRFGFHGIWQGTAVLYDRDTLSLWLHISGECIDGPLKGTTLEFIPGRHVLWGEWKKEFPNTQVMAPVAKYASQYFPEPAAARGREGLPFGFDPTIQSRDDRLELHDLLYGVRVGDVTRAYPFEQLRLHATGVVNDELSGTPIVILFDKTSGSCTAYERRIDGKTLQFSRTAKGHIRSQGSTFDRSGRCIDGPLVKKELPLVFGLQAEWYGWFAVFPGTEIWKP